MATLNLVNMTIAVPNGTFTHDDGHVLCVRAHQWQTSVYVAIFVATNYVAHAATVRSSPGDALLATVGNIALALFLPMSGLMRALNAIRRFARRGSDIEKACRAGALCMVVRVDGWMPTAGQSVDAVLFEETWSRAPHYGGNTFELSSAQSSTDRNDDNTPIPADINIYRPSYALEDSSIWAFYDSIGARAYVDIRMTKFHGTYSLPQGYGFAIVPRDTILREVDRLPHYAEDLQGVTSQSCVIASNYSIAKALASLVQALAALAVLIGHRDGLIVRWGYASFHLTVLPYLFMTIFNFISNLCTADYDCLYMVESLVMEEAKERGGLFNGSVAATCPLDQVTTVTKSELQNWNGLNGVHVRMFAQELLGMVVLPVRLYDAAKLYLQRKRWPTRSETIRHIHLRMAPEAQHSANLSPSQVPPPDGTNRNLRLLTFLACFHGADDIHEASLPPASTGEAHGNLRPTFTYRLITFGKNWVSHYLKGDSDRAHRHTCAATYTTAVLRFGRSKADTRRKICLVSTDGTEFTVQAPMTAPSFFQTVKVMCAAIPVDFWLAWLRLVQSECNALRCAGDRYRTCTEAFPQRLAALFNLLPKMINLPMSFVRYIWAPCMVCSRENEQERKRSTLCFPMCPRFLRTHNSQDTASTETGMPGIDSAGMELRTRRSAKIGICIEISAGLLAIGLLLTFIGWRSHGFSSGNSSLAEKTIMLLWICEGAVGILLPLLTLKEVALIFLILPYYTLEVVASTPVSFVVLPTGNGSIPIFEIGAFIALIPVGLFVAPAWGFVIVGQMLVEWGRCVTLY